MLKSLGVWVGFLLLLQSFCIGNGFLFTPPTAVRAEYRRLETTKKSFSSPQTTSSLRRRPGSFLKSKLNGDDDVVDEAPIPTSEKKLEWNAIIKQAKVFWEMSFPYYKESIPGRWLFGGMLVMTVLNSAVSVAFSYLGKDFWNALSSKNVDEFYPILVKYAVALVIGAPVAVLYRYQRERLAVNWREWMTDRTLQLYGTAARVYYKLEQQGDIDNPDQRISEDVRSFTAFSLQLFLTIVTSVIDLVSFSIILYSIQPQLFGAIVAYATFGTITTTFLGNKLVGLNFLKLQREADFRYALVRLRENAESIAFYSGEDLERKSLGSRLKSVIENKRDINAAQRNLEFFTTAYQYLIQILPVAVVAPQYFAGSVPLGVVSQSAGAFNHILSDLSILVNQFEQLSAFSAGIDRLSQFFAEIRRVDGGSEKEDGMSLLQLVNHTTATVVTNGHSDVSSSSVSEANGSMTKSKQESTIELVQLPPIIGSMLVRPIVSVEDMTLLTPDGKRRLIKDLNFDLQQGQDLLIVGASGAGKSSLLRAIAGLWSCGSGTITRPDNDDLYFLPQRPYCVLGSLRDQLLYPSLEDDESNGDNANKAKSTTTKIPISRSHRLKHAMTDQELLGILDQVYLGELATRVGEGDPIKGLYKQDVDWSNMLSLGEQQRLAFGRVLVNEPKLVILDEATSALDVVAEKNMYNLLKDMVGLTYISVGHRPSLLAYHDKRLRLNGDDDYEFRPIDDKQARLDMAEETLHNL